MTIRSVQLQPFVTEPPRIFVRLQDRQLNRSGGSGAVFKRKFHRLLFVSPDEISFAVREPDAVSRSLSGRRFGAESELVEQISELSADQEGMGLRHSPRGEFVQERPWRFVVNHARFTEIVAERIHPGPVGDSLQECPHHLVVVIRRGLCEVELLDEPLKRCGSLRNIH
jgi:hypothetical protein